MLDKQTMVTAHNALPGRTTAMSIDDTHFVNGSSLTAAPQSGQQQILIGMGCFWGAERLFWQLDGVISTSVGYSGGFTPNPTYEEVCSGKTGHTEVVRVIFDPERLPLTELLRAFWERHDPRKACVKATIAERNTAQPFTLSVKISAKSQKPQKRLIKPC